LAVVADVEAERDGELEAEPDGHDAATDADDDRRAR
jgi:hypothetical protein